MTTSATDPRVRRLAQEISGIKQRLNALSLTPQLASSSIEDGAVTAYDRDGQLTMVVGKQHDGTHAPNVVTGPTPDAPAGLTVAGGQMSVTATWDGSWSGGGVAPMDLARIEVHVTEAAVTLPDPGFDSATRVGTIETAAGASLTFAAQQGEAWVWLIARTLPGKASEPSGPAKADVSGAVDPAVFEQLETDLTDAQARLDSTVADLAQAKTDLDRLDTDLAAARTDLDGLGGRLDTTRTDLDQARTDLYEPGGRVDVVQSTLTGQVSAVDAKAIAANSLANQAKTDAATAAGIANGKGDVLIQSATPAAAMQKATTLWIDTTSGANTPKRWSGSTWTVVTDKAATDAASAAALAQTNANLANAAAAAAQATADRKTQTYTSDTTPTAPSGGFTKGDVWFKTSDKNRPYVWSGTAWVDVRDQAIADAAAQAATGISNAAAALSAAQAAQATADGAISTYYQDTAPWADGSSQPAAKLGDLWYKTSTNAAYRWNGTAWTLIQDNQIAAALAAAQNAQSTADGKIDSFYQTTAPTVCSVGDLWFDTDDKNRPYYCTKASPSPTWTLVADGRIADAQSKADAAAVSAASAITQAQTAQSTADGKAVVYYGSTQPTGLTAADVNDLWLDNTNKVWRWTGSAWAAAQDQSIGTALANANAAQTAANNAQSAANTAQSTADTAKSDAAAAAGIAGGKADVLIQSAAPAASFQKSTTLWIDTTGGANAPKRWSGSAWVVVTDKAATDAASAAAAAQSAASTAQAAADAAQTTANRKITTYYSSTTPPAPSGGFTTGDLWVDLGNNSQVKRWSGTGWVVTNIASTDYVASRGTDLVTNGTGYLMNNYNFSGGGFTFDPTDAPPGASGCFVAPKVKGGGVQTMEYIPVNVTKSYRVSGRIRQRGTATDARAHIRVYFFDSSGNRISRAWCQIRTGTATTLSAPLNPGDTTMKLVDASGWNASLAYYFTYINFYDYVDPNGRAWPAHTYTRNSYQPNYAQQLSAFTAVDTATNTVTLRSPWTGPAKAAGTPVGQGLGGDSANFPVANSVLPGATWDVIYSAIISGAQTSPYEYDGKFPFGTATVAIQILSNYSMGASSDPSTSDMAFGAISVSDAAAAQATADAAMTTASGKNQILWDFSDAPATASGSKTGDVWNKYQIVNNKTSILRTWTSDGTYWKESALTETYLPQVNIGTGTYGELDGLRLKAKSVQANTILVDGSVGTVLLADGAVTATKVNAQSVAGAVGSFLSIDAGQLTASSANLTSAVVDKLFANIFAAKKITAAEVNAQSVAGAVGSFIQLDAGQLTVTGSTNLSEAVAQKFFANIFAANKITGNEINAQSVAGAVGDFVNVKAENIQAGFITAGMAFSTGSFVAGQIFGKCAQMNANGFSTLQVAEDGTQYVSTTLGTPNGTDSLAVFNAPNKPPVFEVSSDGAVSAADLAVEDDPTIAGRPLLGKTFDSAAETGWIDDLPKGIIGRGSFRSLVSGKSVTNGFQDLGIMSFTIQPGRSYRITLPYAYVPTLSSGAQAQVSLIAFYTQGTTATPQPADPTRSSGRLGQASGQVTLSTTSYPVTNTLSFVFDGLNTVPVEMRILLSAFAGPNLTMGYSVADNTVWNCIIEDIGTAVPDTARLSTAASISTYTKTYVASDSRSYNGDASGSVDTFGNSKNILRHGQYLDANKNLRSAVVFPAAMSTDLSGATITKAEIYVESLHWAFTTGGTARFFPMTGSTLPGTLPSVSGTPITKRFTSRAQGFWLQVPTSWFSASNRGFYIGPAADATQTNYGYFAGHTHSKTTARPKVRITYTK